MKNLDKRLREMVLAFSYHERSDLEAGELVAQIKQAFYADLNPLVTQLTENTQRIIANAQAMTGIQPIVAPNLMTGQEWYDRLMKEFLSVNRIYENSDDWVAKFTDFVEAAKRASGVEG